MGLLLFCGYSLEMILMKKSIFLFVFSFLFFGCYDQTAHEETAVISTPNGHEVLNLNVFLDVSEGEASKILKSFSSPFELRGKVKFHRYPGVVYGEKLNTRIYATIAPCNASAPNRRLKEEFDDLAPENRNAWLLAKQKSGIRGWKVVGILPQNTTTLTSELSSDFQSIVTKEGEYLHPDALVLRNKNRLTEIPYNECISLNVEHSEEPFGQDLLNSRIGQVKILGLKELIDDF